MFARIFLLALSLEVAHAQGTLPTFRQAVGEATYTLAGGDPARGGATTIPTVLVPVTLSFEAKKSAGGGFAMDAAADAARVRRSPVFAKFAFGGGEATQFGDAMMRATFPKAGPGWHTLLGEPAVKPVKIAVPAGYGYILTSKKTGGALGIADLEFVQKEIFKRVPKQAGTLVIALTHNTAFYALGDATVCCSWGTHGVDAATGNSFVLASYLRGAPQVVEDGDVQPLTQQLAELLLDPLRDPLFHGGRGAQAPGNSFPAWMRTVTLGGCAGTGAGSTYFQLQPTDTNPKNNLPASKGFAARMGGATYHLQNVALLPWYTGGGEGLGTVYSFPDAQALTERSRPCPVRGGRGGGRGAAPGTAHRGGSAGERRAEWAPADRVLDRVRGGRFGGPDFAAVGRDHRCLLHPGPQRAGGHDAVSHAGGMDTAAFKADIARLKGQGKKVLISLGGGGQVFTLADPNGVGNFVTSVGRIVSEYGFDGIDIDFETPSLVIDPGDTDFRHPKTPSIVHLIAGMRQLRERFGAGFMISLVPEGTQIPAGYPGYGGQFGSYLPIAWGIRDILSFIDVQDYNTPPLQGLDGEIYQPGTVDYHAAMTELVLRGFPVGGDAKHVLPGVPPEKVAVGFLTTDTTPEIVSQAMDYLITGKAPAGTKYRLRTPAGYPGLIGAMFWTLDADRRGNYNFSNM